MPVYEYACNACGNRFELRQGFDSKPKAKCPKCGKIAPRMISAPPIVFKGSGFYNTDYKNGTGAKPSEAADAKTDSTKSESATSDSSTSASASSDSSKSGGDSSSAKPESKSESKSPSPAATTP